MARKSGSYEFEDETGTEETGSEITLKEGNLGVQDDAKNETLIDAPDSELFDDLPHSPFKSDPTQDGGKRQTGEEVDETDEIDEIDEVDEVNETDEVDETVQEDEHEQEDDNLPRSFRKRLLRAERLIQETRDENRDLAKRNKALETAVDTRKADEAFNAEKTKLQTDIETAAADLEAAIEDGTDSKKTVALTRKLAQLEGDLKVLDVKAEQRKAVEKEAPAVTRQPRLASQWMRKHPRFKTSKAFGAAARAIDRDVAADGFDPETEEYYQELDKRLKKDFPDEYKPARKRGEEPERRRQAPTRDMGRDQGGVRGAKPVVKDGFTRRGNTITVSPAQKANMRKFGLDPDNANDLKAYVRENLRK